MKTDILGRTEVEELVNRFYDKVKVDPVLAPFFAHVNWDKHLPLMYSFWENTLMFTGGYFGNPLRSHQNFHKHSPLSEEHFVRWQQLFIATVDELYAGEKAELARQRALSISTVMQLKLLAPKVVEE